MPDNNPDIQPKKRWYPISYADLKAVHKRSVYGVPERVATSLGWERRFWVGLTDNDPTFKVLKYFQTNGYSVKTMRYDTLPSGLRVYACKNYSLGRTEFEFRVM